ncbi:MAG: hypothetical protein AB8G22_09560 [Saprospiraceae bacterium]
MQKLLIVSCLLVFFSCGGLQDLAEPSMEVAPRIAFYNVENLFDTEDDTSNPKDNEFLPSSDKKWTPERYDKKLNDLASVIAGMKLPAFVGLCEVENEKVVRDLAKNSQLKAADYEVVHIDGPDFRGIDNAFMYCKKGFSVLNAETFEIKFPIEVDTNGYTTRDILYIEGIQNNNDTLHFFINHWPSRSGGLEASQPRRVYVAQQLRKIVDELMERRPGAQIIIMGDFNDETNNQSIAQELRAQPNKSNLQAGELYNCFAELDAAGRGSYNYRGNLNMLDQIIVSGSLLDQTGWRVTNPEIYEPEFITFTHDEYGKTPNRTFGGDNYYGGFSDHYPVYVELEK